MTPGPQGFALILSDDGCGFEPAAAAGQTFGLMGMRQRVSAFGGTLVIESAAGSGTTLRVAIPA